MSDFDPMEFPEVDEWSGSFTPRVDFQGFLARRVPLSSGMAVAELIMPQFVEVSGCVIVRFKYDESSFEQWRERFGSSPSELERTLNHVHLWDIFDAESTQEEVALEVLAEKMCVGWQVKANGDFPDKRFVGEITAEYGPTVTVYTQST
ncbi:hypothetical protein [Saccharomonospora iraqiensis]|uniref:hypothetical protein n=1 Tax=Saccharomonospora iraqiensis TaxID=52698 RepID=UPI0012FB28BF|nr:hypothetical protein [Saccharomonospora iraqiensis]